MKNLKEFFNSDSYINSRKSKTNSYYWNDIINYCSFFSCKSYSIIELGCGSGNLIGQIKGSRKVGVDFSKKLLDVGKSKYPDVEFIEMDVYDLQIKEKFDLVIISNLIGFLPDIQTFFEVVKNICHERTKIIVSYYNHFYEPILKLLEFVNLRNKIPNQNWLSQSDINNLLGLSGFKVFRESKRMIFPFRIPLFSYILNNILAKFPFFKLFCINNFSFACLNHNSTEPLTLEKYSVSIIIPARNESGNIENAIKRIPNFGKSQEIIFIEGNSKDNTWDKIQENKIKYASSHNIIALKQPGIGKYDAVKTGFEIAKGEILMILDADLTVQPEDLYKFYNAISSGYGDFINGCRLVYPMEKEAMRFLNMLGNKAFSICFTWLLDKTFKDTLCGTKVIFKRDYINLKNNRHYFGDFDPFGDFDLIFGAYKLNLNIVELPIRYKERTYGSTNISRFRHGLILLKMCLFAARKIKFR